MSNKYDDILHMEHHVSEKHPQMSMEERAAQFAPFAALTGFEDEVKETARLTDEKIEIDEEVKAILDRKIGKIIKNINSMPKAKFTYFVPDDKKEGGKYVDKVGVVKKIDVVKQIIYLMDKSEIDIKQIIDISTNEDVD